jgi:hypothetical protein
VRLELTAGAPDEAGGVEVTLLVVNDSTDDAQVDRSLLFGPHPAVMDPPLLAAEPSRRKGAQRVDLAPGGIIGRRRHYVYESGTVTFHGYLLREPADRLLPDGPGDDGARWAAASPLEITFDR